MKKILTVILACVLALSAFSLLAVSAETGDPIYVFNVKGVNGMIGGEDCVLFTTQDAYNSGNPNWAVTVLLEVKDDGSLVVKEKAIAGQGTVPAGVKVGDGVVALVVHSAASKVEDKDKWANVEAKLAAQEADVGMTVVLDGIDLENASGEGTATLYPAGAGGAGGTSSADSSAASSETSSAASSEVSSAASSEVSSEASSAASTSSETSSAVSETSSEASSAVSSEASSAASSDAASSAASSATQSSLAASSETSEASDGLSGGVIAIIVIAVVVIVAAVVAIVVVKRKK